MQQWLGGDVAYSAYYPSSAYVNGNYVLDIADQTEDYNNFDFLYAEKSTSSKHVEFTFNHALSFLQFSINFLNNGSAFYMSSKVDGDKATFTSILHPGAGNTEKTVFYIGDSEYTVSGIKSLDFKSNSIHTYNIILGRDEALFTDISIKEWNSSSPSEDVSADILTPASYCDGEPAETFNGVEFDPDSEIKEYKISKGTFDGNGYTITNPANSEGEFSGKSTSAIFDTIGSLGKVFDLNVNIEETYFSDTNTDSLPIITAITAVNYGIVENCSCEGSIKMSNDPYRYGIFLVGSNYGSVIECSNNATFISTGDDSIYDDLDIIKDNNIFS